MRIGDKPRLMSVAKPAERSPYCGYRFPREIIAHAVWLYFRFHLSFRDFQDLLADRSIVVSLEATRQRCTKFGTAFARRAAAATSSNASYDGLYDGGRP